PTMPDLRVRNGTGGVREQQCVPAHERVTQQVVVGGHRADQNAVAVVAHTAELVDLAEVDEYGRGGEPQPQHRHQALPARDDLGVLAGLRERRHGAVDGGRRDVIEIRRDHRAPPSVAVRMACQTRIGEQGISMSLTPRWRTASITALTTAGVDAIVPASPTPLTPSGFVVAGVSVRPVVNDGRSTADGSRYSANEPDSRVPDSSWTASS